MERLTAFSPIWNNGSHKELSKLTHSNIWKRFRVTHLTHIFQKGTRRGFPLPAYMKFYYLQLQQAIRAQGADNVWTLSPNPILHLISSVTHAYFPVLHYVIEYLSG